MHGASTKFAFLTHVSLNHRKLQAASRQRSIDRDRRGLLLGLGSMNNPGWALARVREAASIGVKAPGFSLDLNYFGSSLDLTFPNA